ncbi:MAG: ATP-binding protein [Treponema sp.]|nr:ATP-binding protein [Treponema sp.]
MGITIPKRISQAILNSLSAGVVPRIGLEYIAVGRKREIETALGDFENLSEGAAAFRFIIGRYGSGKTFFLQALRNYALDRDYVCADADLSPDKKLTGSAGAGRAAYRELMQRLSTKIRPDGGALEALIQRWINKIQTATIQEGYAQEESGFASRVEWKIHETLGEMKEYVHGFDFASVLSQYYKAFISGDDEKKNAALRWIRGEYTTRTEAKRLLFVGEIATDDSWYDYLKLFAFFCVKLGYKGLLVFVDEGVNLYKIANRRSRENNYEKLLAIFNDIMQGKAQWLGFYMGGTPQFLEDERRGLASYPALKSRLEENRFIRSGHVDSGSPIIRLSALSNEELFILLERLTEIHALHYGYDSWIGENEITAFLELALSSPGAAEFITPREITRDYLALLNILKDESNADYFELIQREDRRVKAASPEELYAQFQV